MNEVATTDNKALVSGHLDWTEKQIELIKTTVAKGTNNDQLALFLYTCKRTGLDPLAKQIHCVVRQTKNGPVMSLQTAIDGYRLIADRSGKYAGNDDPIYDNEEKPTKATVTVYKLVGGVKCAFTATARWAQYYPGDLQGFMWKKMPHLMLGKCAEALALRKAFPAELSGVYTTDEMAQAEVVEVIPPHQKPQRLSATAEPTQEELEAKALEAKARYAKEQEKSAPEAIPGPINGNPIVVGLVMYATDKNKGGYVNFAIDGCQKENGKDIMFSSKDEAIITKMKESIANETKVAVTYIQNENPNYANSIVEVK